MKQVFLSLVFLQFLLFSSSAAVPSMANDANSAAPARTFSPAGGSPVESSLSGESTASASVINTPQSNTCRSDFKFGFIPGLNCQFEDLSRSDSHIISREWNFGDVISGNKNRSHQKNPVHEFSGPGVYNVSLTITSQSGCVDSVSKQVTTGGAGFNAYIYGHVVNSVSGEPIAGQPVNINASTIHYSAIKLTNSEGLYQDTIPDITSGIPVIISVFDCNDSLHAQTIYSSSSPTEVNFSICALAPCKSKFASVLDTNNLVQNTFVFTDSSEGHPNHWLWSFGDGATSQDQNPVHSYVNAGHFTVCLTVIKKDLSGEIICSDSACSEVVTPSYYNLGGLLFAGLYPINNPASTGDTGVAYLYRSKGSLLIPVDTVSFTYLGYYAFLHLMEGRYVVKAELKKGSADYGGFVPAYFGDQLKWQFSSTIDLTNGSNFTSDIHLVRGILTSGTGSIGGYVSHKDRGQLMRDAEVILFNADMEPMTVATSDDGGRFDFGHLAFGTYYLYAEVTGKYSCLQEILIDESAPIADGIVIEVADVDFTGIGQLSDSDPELVTVFPNPSPGNIHLLFSAAINGEIVMELVSTNGTTLMNRRLNGVHANEDCMISLGDIPKGLYFLNLRSDNGRLFTTRKIIKN